MAESAVINPHVVAGSAAIVIALLSLLVYLYRQRLFILWWVVLLAVGVGVLYGRQARSVAAAFLGVYAGLALLIAVTMTALGGTT